MKRNHEIKIRFNEKEFEQLTEKVRKSKLSREKFVRQCILKKSVKEPPQLDYYKLLMSSIISEIISIKSLNP